MSSDPLIAVATDALRGVVQAALPAGSVVCIGPPAPGEVQLPGLSLHLYRIGVMPLVRAVPVLGADGRRMRPEIGLQLDYLLSGLGGEALEELGLLGRALQALSDSPVRERASLAALVSQPERLEAVGPGSLGIQWRVLDLPVEQASAVWLASGMRQRGGLFCRAETVWRALPD